MAFLLRRLHVSHAGRSYLDLMGESPENDLPVAVVGDQQALLKAISSETQRERVP